MPPPALELKPIVTGFAALLLLAGPAQSFAQTAPKVHRVGVVSPLAGDPEPSTVRVLRQRLHELGYVEGKNLIVETRFAEGRPERIAELCTDLIRRNVDVIVAGSGMVAAAARKATSSIPIVFAGTIDPVSGGLVTSLARPSGNITGATFGGGPEIAGKWLELLREAVPGMTRTAVLVDPNDPSSDEYLHEIRAAARTLRVRIDQFDASNDAMLERAFAGIGASGAQGLIVAGSGYFGGNRRNLVRSAAEKRLPAIYFFSLFPEAGGLMSYGGSLEDSYRRAASHVDRILKGAKPADLPVDQATKYELVINLKTAKALGITIPRSLLARADRVIE